MSKLISKFLYLFIYFGWGQVYLYFFQFLVDSTNWKFFRILSWECWHTARSLFYQKRLEHFQWICLGLFAVGIENTRRLGMPYSSLSRSFWNWDTVDLNSSTRNIFDKLKRNLPNKISTATIQIIRFYLWCPEESWFRTSKTIFKICSLTWLVWWYL